MDVYQILMQDHRIAERIFSEIDQADDGSVGRREQLFGRLRVALEDHTVVEESLFYPEIDKCPAIKEMVAEAYDEHAEFDQILQEISELPSNKADWLERIRELGGLVQEHARKEENRMFPAARREFDQSRAEELGRRVIEMRQKPRPDREQADHDEGTCLSRAGQEATGGAPGAAN
jgi:iron-sulfur cluster repair protein YtfE (RIC family)